MLIISYIEKYESNITAARLNLAGFQIPSDSTIRAGRVRAPNASTGLNTWFQLNVNGVNQNAALAGYIVNSGQKTDEKVLAIAAAKGDVIRWDCERDASGLLTGPVYFELDLEPDEGPDIEIPNPTLPLGFALSDETSDLSTGTAKLTWRFPFAFRCSDVKLSVNTAPTGANIIVDVNDGGASIFATRPSIDAGEKTSETAAAALDFVASAAYHDFAADAEVTFDVDQIGSTIKGKGLKVTLVGAQIS